MSSTLARNKNNIILSCHLSHGDNSTRPRKLVGYFQLLRHLTADHKDTYNIDSIKGYVLCLKHKEEKKKRHCEHEPNCYSQLNLLGFFPDKLGVYA